MTRSLPDGAKDLDQDPTVVSERFERNTAVNGTPDDDDDDDAINHGQSATEPAEGDDGTPPPNEGSPQG